MENGQNHQRESTSLTNWSAERQFLGRFYLSQGFNTRQQVSNDCGATSLAVVLNMLLFQANLKSSPVEKGTILERLRPRFWQRLPGWIPNVGGATSPWGLAAAFNELAEKIDLDWRAEHKSHARRAHVLEQLMTGKPATALKVWKNGGAHWVNLVRYSSEKDKLYYLDPNPYLEHLSPGKRLQSQTWSAFEADWSRAAWWTRLLGIHCEIILYAKVM